MANNKHMKNIKKDNLKKRKNVRAGGSVGPKTKNKKSNNKQNEKFNFDNEIVIGVNVISNDEKDKPSKKTPKQTNKTKKLNNMEMVKNKKKNLKKSTKKEKSKKKINGKKIITIIKIIVIIALFIGITIFIMTTPIFNVTEIKITGNSKISKERIESLSKISLNVNTYQYSKNEIIKNIKEEPYIDTVQIKRKLPNIISIEIKERTKSYVISNLGSYIYIDKQGYILEVTNDSGKIPEIIGFTSKEGNLIPGNRLCDEDLEKLNIIIKITESLESNDMECNINSLDIQDKNDICLILSDEGKKVHLGNASNINDRILMLKEILLKEKGKIGEVFIQDLNKVFFREVNWIE